MTDLISRAAALTLCDEYPYVEGVKVALQDLPAVASSHTADTAAIREAALLEAADVAQLGSDILGERMRNAKDKKEKRDWQSMLFAAVDIKHAILALIGEKK